jgi:hypothetical protein
MKCFILIAYGRYPYCEKEKHVHYVTQCFDEAQEKMKKLERELDSDCWLLRIEDFKDKRLEL